VFAHRHTTDAVLVIADPDQVHLVWSELPGTDGVARIDLGGQRHVRYAGYTHLAGRRFSITRRFASEPGHLWARAGAPVELVSFNRGVLEALVTTPFASPKTLTVRGSCDDVVYEPSDVGLDPSKEVASRDRVAVHGTLLELYAAPSGSPFVALHIDPDQPIELDVVERTELFLRVNATVGDVDIDAWASQDQLEADNVGGGGNNGSGAGLAIEPAPNAMGTIVRDAPLFVGAKPVPLEGAYVENGARVYLYSEETLDGQVYRSFGFMDRLITAPGNSRLWVAKDAISQH
jgi:hypothetical protein